MNNANTHLYSSVHFKFYSGAIAADKDLQDDDPGNLGRMCRAIMVLSTDGDLVVTDFAGNNHTLPLVKNVQIPIQVKKLESTGSTAEGVLVFW